METNYVTCNKLNCSHAFSTRSSGHSNGIFESLNLGFGYGDDKGTVRKNWEILSKKTQIPIEHLAWTQQVHKNKIAIVDYKDCGEKIEDHLIGYDGLITNKKNLTLCIFTADCAPLLLYDSKQKIIGAIHCGWKPICADIIKNAIGCFVELGSHTKDIQAAIGPCIGPCCFEVGQEVVDAFKNLLGTDFSSEVSQNNKYGKSTIDLQKAIQLRLIQLGVKEEFIHKIEECTSCNNQKYFSYRKQNGQCGRMANIISISN